METMYKICMFICFTLLSCCNIEASGQEENQHKIKRMNSKTDSLIGFEIITWQKESLDWDTHSQLSDLTDEDEEVNDKERIMIERNKVIINFNLLHVDYSKASDTKVAVVQQKGILSRIYRFCKSK